MTKYPPMKSLSHTLCKKKKLVILFRARVRIAMFSKKTASSVCSIEDFYFLHSCNQVHSPRVNERIYSYVIYISGGQTFFTAVHKKMHFSIFFYVNVKYYSYVNKCCNIEYFRGPDIKWWRAGVGSRAVVWPPLIYIYACTHGRRKTFCINEE
jgi:hypothetical protein